MVYRQIVDHAPAPDGRKSGTKSSNVLLIQRTGARKPRRGSTTRTTPRPSAAQTHPDARLTARWYTRATRTIPTMCGRHDRMRSHTRNSRASKRSNGSAIARPTPTKPAPRMDLCMSFRTRRSQTGSKLGRLETPTSGWPMLTRGVPTTGLLSVGRSSSKMRCPLSDRFT